MPGRGGLNTKVTARPKPPSAAIINDGAVCAPRCNGIICGWRSQLGLR